MLSTNPSFIRKSVLQTSSLIIIHLTRSSLVWMLHMKCLVSKITWYVHSDRGTKFADCRLSDSIQNLEDGCTSLTGNVRLIGGENLPPQNVCLFIVDDCLKICYLDYRTEIIVSKGSHRVHLNLRQRISEFKKMMISKMKQIDLKTLKIVSFANGYNCT